MEWIIERNEGRGRRVCGDGSLPIFQSEKSELCASNLDCSGLKMKE